LIAFALTEKNKSTTTTITQLNFIDEQNSFSVGFDHYCYYYFDDNRSSTRKDYGILLEGNMIYDKVIEMYMELRNDHDSRTLILSPAALHKILIKAEYDCFTRVKISIILFK
jgi:hypothetical protein